MGFMIVMSWLCLALVFVALGYLCQSRLFATIGAIMVIVVAAVNGLS